MTALIEDDARWPSVAIVMVNWNGWRDCLECLDSVFAQDYPSFHVVLVDNDSSDGSVQRILEWCAEPRFDPSWQDFDGVGHLTVRGGDRRVSPIKARLLEAPERLADPLADGCRLTVVRSGGNLGFAGGNNVGLKVIGDGQFSYFWLLNTDTVVDRSALKLLVERARQDSAIGMVGSTLRYYHRPGFVQAMCGGRLHLRNMLVTLVGAEEPVSAVPDDPSALEQSSDYVMGASLMVSADFLRDIGPMQEDYFLYYEELDWSMRSRGRFKIGYAPRSHVFHKVGGSSSQVVSEFSMNLFYRNKIKFVSRFMPAYVRRTVWYMFVEMLRHVYSRRWVPAKLIARTLMDTRELTVQGRKI